MSTRTDTITVSFSGDDVDKLDYLLNKFSRDEVKSRGALVRRAIREMFDREYIKDSPYRADHQ